jgi:hypothetical protein
MTVVADDSFTIVANRSAQLEHEIAEHPDGFRVLTGDRPTGPLHLGHYFGTLANRVRLQRTGVEVFLVIADYQVITDRDSVGNLSGNVRELLLDYLAAGLDPTTTTIFAHSAVPALNQRRGVPRARRATEQRTAAARRRRDQDEQEPRQRDRATRYRRPHGAAHPSRQDRQRADRQL